MAATAKKPVAIAPRKVLVSDLIRHKAKELVVDFDGLPASITYNPALLTADLIDAKGSSALDHVTALCNIITEWDLADEDGDIPVGPKHVDEVSQRAPFGVLRYIYDAIVEDSTPDPTSARD